MYSIHREEKQHNGLHNDVPLFPSEFVATSWKRSCDASRATAKEQVKVEKSREMMMDCFLREGTLSSSSSGLYGNHLYNGR